MIGITVYESLESYARMHKINQKTAYAKVGKTLLKKTYLSKRGRQGREVEITVYLEIKIRYE